MKMCKINNLFLFTLDDRSDFTHNTNHLTTVKANVNDKVDNEVETKESSSFSENILTNTTDKGGYAGFYRFWGKHGFCGYFF